MTKEQIKQLIGKLSDLQHLLEAELTSSQMEGFNATFDEIEVGYLRIEPDSDYGIELKEEGYTATEADTYRAFQWMFERFASIFSYKATKAEIR